MDYFDCLVALGMLRKAGLTATEISRLRGFSRRFAVTEADRSTPDLSRLEFVRWLVTTHRLSDQIDQHYDAGKCCRQLFYAHGSI